jgi:hypothetical protein
LIGLLRRTAHCEDDLAQTKVVEKQANMRFELAGPTRFQNADQVFTPPRRNLKWQLTLQTEAAIATSGRFTSHHAYCVPSRILQAKGDFTSPYRRYLDVPIRILKCRARRIIATRIEIA